MELDFAEEHTLQVAIQNGSVTAQTCREGEECDEGAVLLAHYEGLAARGLLRLTRMSGSRFSPAGAEFTSFEPSEAGAALVQARSELVDAQARLESALDVLGRLADQLHIGGYKDRNGHAIDRLKPLKDADLLLDRLAGREPTRAG